MNVQYAIQDEVVFVLEVNPRASRTVPYVSKATGLALAKIATRAGIFSDMPLAVRAPYRAGTEEQVSLLCALREERYPELL